MNNLRGVLNQGKILVIINMISIILMFSSCSTHIKVSQNLNQYKHSVKNGIWIVADDSLSMIRFETYRNGVLSGPYIEYYKNGICATTGRYHNGKRVGWWVHRSSLGNPAAKDKYRNGVIVSKISYNPVF